MKYLWNNNIKFYIKIRFYLVLNASNISNLVLSKNNCVVLFDGYCCIKYVLLHCLEEIEKCFMRNVSIQDVVKIAKHFCWQKPYSFTIHDKLTYEGNLSFLHENQVIKWMRFTLLLCHKHVYLLEMHTWHTWQHTHLTQWLLVLTIGMNFLLQQALYEFYQCTSIMSHECLCMINIIQREFIDFYN